MQRLIVFDLDGTLAELGAEILPQNLAKLKALEEQGARVAVCSGKPTYYLCGLMRQVGLKAPILVGENGAVIQYGVDLPPRTYWVAPQTKLAKASIRLLREAFEEVVPGLWYQPNEVGLTPFPRNAEEFDAIQACIDRLRPQLADIEIYRHSDSFDVTPAGITKETGLKQLGAMLNIPAEQTVAVGDGVNDYPMFAYAGLALGIHVQEPEKVDRNFACIDEALAFLLGDEA